MTASRSWRTTTTRCWGSSPLAAVTAWSTRLRPPIRCRTLGVTDRIRVPLPAAMTMTAAGAVGVTCPLLTGSRPGSRRLRPRPGGGRGRTPTVSEIRYGWTVGAYPAGDRVTAVGRESEGTPTPLMLRRSAPRIRTRASRLQRPACCRYTRAERTHPGPSPTARGETPGQSLMSRSRSAPYAAVQRAPVAHGCAPVASRTGPGTEPPARAGRMPHSSDFAVGREDRAGWGHVQFPLRSPSLLRQAGSGATHRARRAAWAGRRRRAHPPRPGDRPRAGGGRGAARHRPHRHLQPDPHPESPPPAVGGP